MSVLPLADVGPRLRSLAACALVLAGLRPAAAQEPLPLARLDGAIVLDGVPDEPSWRSVEPLPMTVYTPTFGAPPTERSDIRIAYDDTHLYVGAVLYDSDVRGIRTNTLYRDQYSGDDLLGIVLDSYNDHETAVLFAINPAGVRSDRTVSNDAEFRNGMPMNFDWNTFWDAVTRRRPDGWSAELRIPFSSMGFQSRDGEVVMGLIVYRLIARKNERHTFPAIPPNWDLGFAKPSRARRVLLRGVYSRKPLYVTPYVLAGYEQTPVLDSARAGYALSGARTSEAGGDLRVNLTDNLTLDLTANTDFAQVEADDQQLNFTRFSLFFPEKRQFFQERSAIFDFNTGGLSRLFHSRRIGLHEGEPVRIYGGARLVGRVGGMDVGFLSLQTERADTLPSENFTVLRLRQQVINPNSTVGAMLASRIGTNGRYNIATGIDALVRAVGDLYITAKWAQTWISGGTARLGAPGTTLLLLRAERRNQLGLRYAVEGIRIGTDYEPGIGFVQRRGVTSGEATLGYQWLASPRSPLRTVTLDARGTVFVRHADHGVESFEAAPSLRLEFKRGNELDLSVTRLREDIPDTFTIAGGLPIAPGTYTYTEARLSHMAPRTGSFRPTATISAGSFYDGWRWSIQATPAWNVSRHLEIAPEYVFNAIRFRDRGLALDAHLARLRLQVAWNVHLSLSTFLQYNSATDDLGLNARLRYNFSEGRDLWVVYDETMQTERPLDLPRPPLTQHRAFALKYTHALIW